MGFLTDLVLKVMYFEGFISGSKIAKMVKLPFGGVVEEAIMPTTGTNNDD